MSIGGIEPRGPAAFPGVEVTGPEAGPPPPSASQVETQATSMVRPEIDPRFLQPQVGGPFPGEGEPLRKVKDIVKKLPELGPEIDKAVFKKTPDFELFVTMSKVAAELGKDVAPEFRGEYEKFARGVAINVATGRMTPDEGLGALVKAREGLQKLPKGAQPHVFDDGTVLDMGQVICGLPGFKAKEPLPKLWAGVKSLGPP